MADLGTAVHHCIARAGARGAVEQADVSSILNNWGVGNTVDNAAVVAQLNAFRTWCAERWPGCPTFVEVPIEANRPDGTRVRGRIDLLVQSSNGWILVDHKSNPGGTDRNEQLALEHGPQLTAYAQALVCCHRDAGSGTMAIPPGRSSCIAPRLRLRHSRAPHPDQLKGIASMTKYFNAKVQVFRQESFMSKSRRTPKPPRQNWRGPKLG